MLSEAGHEIMAAMVQDRAAYLDRYLVVEASRRWEVFNWLQCFDRPALEAELASAGLRVEQCLGSVAGDPFDAQSTEFAVVARPQRE